MKVIDDYGPGDDGSNVLLWWKKCLREETGSSNGSEKGNCNSSRGCWVGWLAARLLGADRNCGRCKSFGAGVGPERGKTVDGELVVTVNDRWLGKEQRYCLALLPC